MGVRHSGQPLSIAATASAQLSQNREWPHDTRATPVREAIKRTSQQSVGLPGLEKTRFLEFFKGFLRFFRF